MWTRCCVPYLTFISGPISDDLHRDAYMANYNRRDRLPNWVAEHLDIFALTAGAGVNRSKSVFKADRDIPTMFRAQLKDYISSGFDRGHQAPAADAVFTQEALDQTFLLTNMAPQIGVGFNRQCKSPISGMADKDMSLTDQHGFLDWAYVEGFVRDLVGPYNDVWVWTGPLFLPQKGEDNKFYMKYQVRRKRYCSVVRLNIS
jgi:endonuclease G